MASDACSAVRINVLGKGTQSDPLFLLPPEVVNTSDNRQQNE